MAIHPGCRVCTGLFRLLKACPRYYLDPGAMPEELMEHQNFVVYFDLMMTWLSVIPYIVSFLLVMSLVYFKTTRLFCLNYVNISQFILVKVLKSIFKEHRPEQSCSEGYGMPSNHAAQIAAFATWILLERYRMSRECPFKMEVGLNNFLFKYVWLTPLLLYSRIWLFYHSEQQIIVGFAVGCLFSCFNFVILHKTTLNKDTLKSGLYPIWIGTGLIDNYSAKSKSYAERRIVEKAARFKLKYKTIQKSKRLLKEKLDGTLKMLERAKYSQGVEKKNK